MLWLLWFKFLEKSVQTHSLIMEVDSGIWLYCPYCEYTKIHPGLYSFKGSTEMVQSSISKIHRHDLFHWGEKLHLETATWLLPRETSTIWVMTDHKSGEIPYHVLLHCLLTLSIIRIMQSIRIKYKWVKVFVFWKNWVK